MSDPTIVVELRALGNAPPDASTFAVRRDDVGFEVTYTGGSASSVTFRVPYDQVARPVTIATEARYRDPAIRRGPIAAAVRPMQIQLSPELHTHKDAKAAGIDVEIQTGDAVFDETVYVDTQAPGDVVRLVLGDDVRAAVVELFRLGFQSVELDGEAGQVTARCTSFVSTTDDAGRGVAAAQAFARLARGLPSVAPLGGEYPRHPLAGVNGALLVLALVVFCAAAPAYHFFVAAVRTECSYEDAPMTCEAPALAGLVAGAVLGGLSAFLASLYARRFRGRSDSSRHEAVFVFGVGLFVWCAGALAIAIAAVLAGFQG